MLIINSQEIPVDPERPSEADDYWLAIIATMPKQVKQACIIDNTTMEKGDVYFYVHWLDYEEDSDNGGRYYARCVQEHPDMISLAGAVVPLKLGKMTDGKKKFLVAQNKHADVLARLQTRS